MRTADKEENMKAIFAVMNTIGFLLRSFFTPT